MNFTSQICTTKGQSKRLLALGLKKETADCILVENPFEKDKYVMFPIVDIDETLENEMNGESIPAWSLHRLIEIYDKTCIFWTDCGDNPYEAMISRIVNKIKWGELNKEYLEK